MARLVKITGRELAGPLVEGALRSSIKEVSGSVAPLAIKSIKAEASVVLLKSFDDDVAKAMAGGMSKDAATKAVKANIDTVVAKATVSRNALSDTVSKLAKEIPLDAASEKLSKEVVELGAEKTVKQADELLEVAKNTNPSIFSKLKSLQ